MLTYANTINNFPSNQKLYTTNSELYMCTTVHVYYQDYKSQIDSRIIWNHGKPSTIINAMR